jgi:hypothetical protein
MFRVAPPSHCRVSQALLKRRVWYGHVAVKQQRQTTALEELVPLKHAEQVRQKTLKLRVAEFGCSRNLGQDELLKEPRRLVDSKLCAEMVDD